MPGGRPLSACSAVMTTVRQLAYLASEVCQNGILRLLGRRWDVGHEISRSKAGAPPSRVSTYSQIFPGKAPQTPVVFRHSKTMGRKEQPRRKHWTISGMTLSAVSRGARGLEGPNVMSPFSYISGCRRPANSSGLSVLNHLVASIHRLQYMKYTA
jgi:hypothetical protein